MMPRRDQEGRHEEMWAIGACASVRAGGDRHGGPEFVPGESAVAVCQAVVAVVAGLGHGELTEVGVPGPTFSDGLTCVERRP